MRDTIEADVCIVGAGYAGLSAARRLTSEGKQVAVLEARDRVGGRVWTVDVDGFRIDLGGAWLGSDHDALRSLAAELGVETYPTYHEGQSVLEIDGKMHRFKGSVPKVGLRTIVALAGAISRVDRMAKKVPRAEPWNADRASEWDALTAGPWLDEHIRNKTARELIRLLVRGGQTADPDTVSLLGVLFTVASSGGVEKTISVEGGSQQDLFIGGAGSLAQKMAADLAQAVRLNSPVRRITQDDSGVTIDSDNLTVRAPKAIVAMPLPLTTTIEWDPHLPEDRSKLANSLPAGSVIKSVAIYDEPFWRSDGMSGESSSTTSPIGLTIDSSPPGGPGVITSFTFPPLVAEHASLAPDGRRKIVCDALAQRFGPKANTPTHFVDHDWTSEPWTKGCFASHFPPGVLTSYGRTLREPFGRVHFAGTETALAKYSYIDGAVTSGYRAADEVLNG